MIKSGIQSDRTFTLDTAATGALITLISGTYSGSEASDSRSSMTSKYQRRDLPFVREIASITTRPYLIFQNEHSRSSDWSLLANEATRQGALFEDIQ